jgi:uracil-DNA glycosylase
VPVAGPSLADPACIGRLVEELAIVQPKIVVVMGTTRSRSSTTSTCRWRAR